MAEPSDTPESGKPKRKRKAEAAAVALRIEEVLRIRLDGAEYHDVVQYAAEKGWDLKERQVREYIGRADDLLVERQEPKRRRVIARHLAQRQSLFARCINAADFRTALAVLADLAKLKGLYATGNDVKELVKLATAQGMRIEELERRLHAAGLSSPPAESPSPPPPGVGTGDARDDGPTGRVPG
ncbi:MAG: hypothetical protein K8U57_00035 [Planctomycetes bacterium]|nr:hypothetical protein [Planctomycetota bacterium]